MTGGSNQIAKYFISKGIELLLKDGMLGFVLPKMLVFTTGWEGTRKQIFDNLELEYVIDCEKAFKDVLLEQVIMVGKKK